MGLVDKIVFEARGAHGCSDSDYTFAMTTCCERVGVVDDELDEFYWNSATPGDGVSLLGSPECPFCASSNWDLRRLEHATQVPDHWSWACDGVQRPGRRQLLSLAIHIQELLKFCRRVAAPLPGWNETLILNTGDPSARYDRHWIASRSALLSPDRFTPQFEKLLCAGYSWINLSVYGVHDGNLIIGVEVPADTAGVPPGRTVVNYSGPPKGVDGRHTWTLSLTIID